ncbi:MAG: DUF58 domain-containing protein [Pseudomonadota bacterium]
MSDAGQETVFDAKFFSQLERLRLVADRPSHGDRPGERRGRRHGSSLDFADFRPYSQGDELRLIDWNIYGRLERLAVKLFHEERDLCLHLLVDTSGSMAVGKPSKLELAKRVAGALAYVGLANHERVALGSLGDRARGMRPQSGRQKVNVLLDAIDQIRAEGETSLGSSVTHYARANARVGGVAVIVSDLLDPPEELEHALNRLFANGFEARVIQIVSQDELHPKLEGDLRMLSMESDDAARGKNVSVTEDTRREYVDNLQRHFDRINAFCQRRNVPYIRIDDRDNLNQVVLGTMRRRRILR